MNTKYVDIDNGKWGVIICYDYDFMDADDIWAICRSFGLSDAKANEAVRVLNDMNTGMTISNADIRMSVVFISDATSRDEWLNTLAHELKHVNDAIIDYYGVRWDGEPAAYLTGYLFQKVVNKLGYVCSF